MPGSYFKLADNAETTLNGDLTDVATSIVVTSVASFPSSFPYLLTIWDESIYPDPSDDPDMELIRVEGAVGNTLTPVTRGYAGTSGVEHSNANRIALLITKEIIDDSTYGLQANIDDAIDGLALHEGAVNPHSITLDSLSPTISEGDMLVESGSGVVRLPVGSTGQVIRADAGEPNGLLWYTPHVSTGFTEQPTYTDLGTGQVSLPAKVVAIADNATFEGLFIEYTLSSVTTGAGATPALVDGINYVVANYNSGSPIYDVITNVDLINNSDVLPALTIFKSGTEVCVLDWDQMGDGLSNKILTRLVKTERFRWESGLALGESTGQIITVSAGKSWHGIVRLDHGALQSDVADTEFWYHSAGVWTSSSVTQYNNTQYDDGTNLQTLINTTRYAVNWVFRSECDEDKILYVLGNGDYTLTQAQEADVPADLPDFITTVSVLVGKIIVQKNAVTATSIESAFVQDFNAAPITEHNNLSGLQGGTAAEYYHLTNAQHTIATQAATGSLDGYLSSTDWNTFNNKIANLSEDATPELGADLESQYDINLRNQHEARFWTATADNKYLGLKAPSSVAASLSWTLPIADGGANQALITDGVKNLSWDTVARPSDITTHSTQVSGVHGTGSDYVAKTSKSSQIGEFAATVVVGRSGAVDYLCDGTADDVQIQAAIDYVNSLGGGSVQVKEGTYLFSSKVTISGLSNIEIIGQKGSTIIKQNANITFGSFEIKGDSSNITIRNLIFDNGNNTATSNAHCVVIGESEHTLISDCIFKNVLYYIDGNGSDGIYINARAASPPAGSLIYDVSVQNCQFLDISRQGLTLIRGERVRVINNYFCVRRSAFNAEPNSTTQKTRDICFLNNYLDGERALIGVESSGVPETRAFSGDGAGIEFNIADANLYCDGVIVSNNSCIGNNDNGNGLKIKKCTNAVISNNSWKGFLGEVSKEYSLLIGNVSGNFSNNNIENYGDYSGLFSYQDEELLISDCLIKEGNGYATDAQKASIKGCTFIDCGDSTHSVIFNDDTNTILYVKDCLFLVDDKTDIKSVFDLFTDATNFNVSAIIDNISVVGSAYKSLIKGNANRGVKLVIKNSYFEDCGTLADNFIHFYSYTGLDSVMLLENNIFKGVLGDISARTCKHIKINNNLFLDCGKEDQNYILTYQCGDVQLQNNYLRDTRSSAKPLYFIQVDSVLSGWTNTTRMISNNQFSGTGFTNAFRVMTDCIMMNNIFNGVSLAEGNFTAPTVPDSTVNYTNEYGFTCQVSIYGGTVTNIDLDGVASGLTSGVFIIPPGGTINITYSVAPTWTWWGL